MDNESMKECIENYIPENNCSQKNILGLHNCCSCDFIEECYLKANSKCNSIFAKSINYGGCNTEEEFWNQLFD